MKSYNPNSQVPSSQDQTSPENWVFQRKFMGKKEKIWQSSKKN